MRKWWQIVREHRWTEEEGCPCKSACCPGRLIWIAEYGRLTFDHIPNLLAKLHNLSEGRRFDATSKMFHFQPFHNAMAENATVHLLTSQIWWSVMVVVPFCADKNDEIQIFFHFSFSTRDTWILAGGVFRQVTVRYPLVLDSSEIVLADTRA